MKMPEAGIALISRLLANNIGYINRLLFEKCRKIDEFNIHDSESALEWNQ